MQGISIVNSERKASDGVRCVAMLLLLVVLLFVLLFDLRLSGSAAVVHSR